MELKTKLFKVSIKLRNVMITFVATVLLCWLSWATLLYLQFLVYLCTVTSHQVLQVSNHFRMFFTSSNFWRKSVVSLTYEGIFVAIGWRWKSTYFKIVLVWQFTELTTGLPGFPVLYTYAQFWLVIFKVKKLNKKTEGT